MNAYQAGVSGPAGSAAIDTNIRLSLPTTNYGTDPALYIGVTNATDKVYRTLMEFDLSDIPSGAVVTGCTLRVNVTQRTSPTPGHVRRLCGAHWLDGDGQSENQATWNAWRTGTAWTQPGASASGSCDSTADYTTAGEVAYTPPAGTGLFTFPDLSSLCQDAVSRDRKLRLRISQDSEATQGNLLKLDSSDGTTAANRPRLTVTWSGSGGGTTSTSTTSTSSTSTSSRTSTTSPTTSTLRTTSTIATTTSTSTLRTTSTVATTTSTSTLRTTSTVATTTSTSRTTSTSSSTSTATVTTTSVTATTLAGGGVNTYQAGVSGPANSAAIDTNVRLSTPTRNWGTDASLFVGVTNAADNIYRTFIEFDLSDIPTNAVVSGCTLRVNVTQRTSPTAGHVQRLCAERWLDGDGQSENQATWDVWKTGAAWTTGGAGTGGSCGAGADYTTDGAVAYTPPAGTGAFTFPDLSGLCQDAVRARGGKLRLRIAQDSEATQSNLFKVDSSDASTAANRPKLTVTWSPGP